MVQYHCYYARQKCTRSSVTKKDCKLLMRVNGVLLVYFVQYCYRSSHNRCLSVVTLLLNHTDTRCIQKMCYLSLKLEEVFRVSFSCKLPLSKDRAYICQVHHKAIISIVIFPVTVHINFEGPHQN